MRLPGSTFRLPGSLKVPRFSEPWVWFSVCAALAALGWPRAGRQRCALRGADGLGDRKVQPGWIRPHARPASYDGDDDDDASAGATPAEKTPHLFGDRVLGPEATLTASIRTACQGKTYM